MNRKQPENQRESGEPESPDESRSRADSNVNPKNPPGERAWNQDRSGIWGLLPQKIFDVIFQGDPAKFPPQYREMLEKYYKRLSDSEK